MAHQGVWIIPERGELIVRLPPRAATAIIEELLIRRPQQGRLELRYLMNKTQIVWELELELRLPAADTAELTEGGRS